MATRAMRIVPIGDAVIGDDQPCRVVAELGQNHDGSLAKCLELIWAAKDAGAWAIKLQKRTIPDAIPLHQRAVMKETPWGETMSYADYRARLEFGSAEYDAIARECAKIGLAWSASVWDEGALDFLLAYDPPFLKIPSACVTDIALLEACRRTGRPIIASTGMSTIAEIDRAATALGPDRLVLLHCKSAYPTPADELNLSAISTLRERFHNMPIGFSNHYPGVWMALCAVVLGASMVEAHLTLDRAAAGTDHAVSWEPKGLATFIRQVGRWQEARGTGELGVAPSERAVLHKLRRLP